MTTSEVTVHIERNINNRLVMLELDIETYRQWKPGSFLQLSLTNKSASEPWLDSRAFSFASWGSRSARILVRIEGAFTSKLFSLANAGFKTTVRYPFGDFLFDSNKKKIFLAGGAGVSVFLSYLDFLNSVKANNIDLLIVHSTKEISEQISNIYKREIPNGVKIIPIVTNSSSPSHSLRFDINQLRTVVPNMENREFFICGPKEFNDYWATELSKIGLSYRVEQWVKNAREMDR